MQLLEKLLGGEPLREELGAKAEKACDGLVFPCGHKIYRGKGADVYQTQLPL